MQKMDVLINITNLESHGFSKGSPFFYRSIVPHPYVSIFSFQALNEWQLLYQGFFQVTTISSLHVSIGLSLIWLTFLSFLELGVAKKGRRLGLNLVPTLSTNV
jgi:hypothetical protein